MKENLEVEVHVKRLGTTFVDGFFEWFEIKEFKGAAFGFRPNEVTSDTQFSEILNSTLENDGEILKTAMEDTRWGVFKTSEDGLAYLVVNKKVLLKDSTFMR
jgi:hypothetical protein